MAAVTADRIIQRKLPSPDGMHVSYAVAATTVIYKHTFVALNAAGYLVSYVAPTSDTTQVGNRIVGVASEHITSQTSAGDANCMVQISGFYEHALSSAVIADTGKPVFATDNATLSKVGAGNAFAGWIRGFISAGNVLVELPDMGMNSGLFYRTSAIIDAATANDRILMIHETENHNGILVLWAGFYVTTTMDGATVMIATLVHTTATDTTTTITFTGVNTMAAGDIIPPAANTVAIGAATDQPLVQVPADKALIAKVTQASTTGGAGKVLLLAAAL